MLENIIQKLKNDFNLTPCIGVELEFYLHNNIDIDLLAEKIRLNIIKERGVGQFEVNLAPSKDLLKYVDYIKKIRKRIVVESNLLGSKADFSSKPRMDDYGSSMHIHINFLEDDNVEKFAKILCCYMLRDIAIFLPQIEDKFRLDKNFMAPTHVCFGGNNRTVAIRIPGSMPKRLEYRLAAASADPYLTIYTILAQIYEGLLVNINTDIYHKIYGNAFDPQYFLQPIK